jgi:hypothetical protein
MIYVIAGLVAAAVGAAIWYFVIRKKPAAIDNVVAAPIVAEPTDKPVPTPAPVPPPAGPTK